jgi:hypothetical protein
VDKVALGDRVMMTLTRAVAVEVTGASAGQWRLPRPVRGSISYGLRRTGFDVVTGQRS